jgi:hypothetical protein
MHITHNTVSTHIYTHMCSHTHKIHTYILTYVHPLMNTGIQSYTFSLMHTHMTIFTALHVYSYPLTPMWCLHTHSHLYMVTCFYLTHKCTNKLSHTNLHIQPAYTHSEVHTLTYTYTNPLIYTFIQSCSHTQTHSVTHTYVHIHILFCCISPNPTHQWLLHSCPVLACLMSAPCSFPFWFYLFFLAMMSIFGKWSIFTLSGSTFPLGHELCRWVRRFLAAMM